MGVTFSIKFDTMLVSASACETDAANGWAGTNQSFSVFGLGNLKDQVYQSGCTVRHLAGHLIPSGVWMDEMEINGVWTFIGY